MSALTEQQIAKIVQYWEDRENIETEIQQLQDMANENDYCREYRMNETTGCYVKSDIRIEDLEKQIEELDADYEKWLNDEVGLELNDRNQDEFTYNLLNNGVLLPQ